MLPVSCHVILSFARGIEAASGRDRSFRLGSRESRLALRGRHARRLLKGALHLLFAFAFVLAFSRNFFVQKTQVLQLFVHLKWLPLNKAITL